jgi:hypothetical protein
LCPWASYRLSGERSRQQISVPLALNNYGYYSPWMGCWSIASYMYLPSYMYCTH